MNLDSQQRTLLIVKRSAVVALALIAAMGCRSRISTAEQDAIDRAEYARRTTGERQINTAQEVTRDLGCGGRRAVIAQFESGQVIPVRPNPGSEVNHRIVYSACPGTAEQLTGTLTRRLYWGRSTIMEDREKVVLKPGRWSIDVFITIPPKAELSWYRMEAVFENTAVYARDRRDFQVVAPPAAPAR